MIKLISWISTFGCYDQYKIGLGSVFQGTGFKIKNRVLGTLGMFSGTLGMFSGTLGMFSGT